MLTIRNNLADVNTVFQAGTASEAEKRFFLSTLDSQVKNTTGREVGVQQTAIGASPVVASDRNLQVLLEKAARFVNAPLTGFI